MNFINVGSIYLFSVINLKGQCEFNIRRFRFFCVDGGGHPQALGLHIACGRLPRRHDGRLLPFLGAIGLPQKNSPSSPSDFSCSPTHFSKGFSCPSSPLTNPSPSLTPRNNHLCSHPSLKGFGSLSALDWVHKVLCFTLGFTVNLSSCTFTTFHNNAGFVTIGAAPTLYI